ncbi:MAG: efflux RND transporter permease subunit [Acidobacteriota bacterium]
MKPLGASGRLASTFINSKLTPLVVLSSILLGLGAVLVLPREEEPQIIVPMIDVFVQMPGASAREVEERVTKPMEKLIWEIPGVEYIYSTSSPGFAMAVVRFYVGEDEERSIVRLNQKMFANFDLIPPGASQPLIKPRYIDDVPILALTLWSDRYDHYSLRRLAAQLDDVIKQTDDVSSTTLIGGQRRQVRVVLDPARLAAYQLTPLAVMGRLQAANQTLPAGNLTVANREFLLETGGFLQSAEEVGNLVVAAHNQKPVYLREVADIVDGPEEPSQYVFFSHGPAAPAGVRTAEGFPAVTISVAKRKGTNAVTVADAVLERFRAQQGSLIPGDVQVTVTRHYGETASEKSNELLFHMAIAVVSVTLLIWLTLGFRESGIVAIAIPVTLALTLTVFYLYGYTLNRITLFALIFSIGILVDDAIVVVENIVRHYRLPENHGRKLIEVAVEAVDEVGNPTILATFTVIAAIIPMAFVRGLMGPYMRPIPVGASAAMVFSLLVAFIVTPWASLRLLGKQKGRNAGHGHGEEDWSTRLYRKVMNPLIHNAKLRWAFLLGVTLLLLLSMSLVYLKWVTVKMLPFDNKSEFQVIIDMPEGTPLEQTAHVARELGNYLRSVPEVTNYQTYVGTASPYNFNGLVRHYYLRRGSNVADIQVNLVSKHERSAQSHDISKRVRPPLTEIARKHGARIKVAEVPPGPPVLQTLVAEIYGPDYQRQIQVSRQLQDILEETPGVVDVDSYVEDDQRKFRFDVDRQKAAIHGVSVEQIAQTLRLAVNGLPAGLVHLPREKEDLNILLRLPRPERSRIEELKNLRLMGERGNLIALGELIRVTEEVGDKSIYHKNLMPVVYVTADVAGEAESPVYAILDLGPRIDALKLPEGYRLEQYTAHQPQTTQKLAMKWDGEWHITYEVFRDLGLAFAAVLVLIYVLVVGWFQTFRTPIVIMAAIPFSLVGILPAHGLMGAFFTATSMIGFIAGAGIVVRNSIILVDFVELRLKQGMPLAEAVVDAGAVRFRPMMLTAAAVVVGSAVILFDPIFQGLAISLMAGEIASLLLSRMTVPILYYLSESRATPSVQ